MVKEKGPGMSDDEVCLLNAAEIRGLYAKRAISPIEVAEAYFRRIEQFNPATNAMVTVASELALAEAKVAEQKMMREETLAPLHGIPFSVKDNIFTKGIRSTSGSLLFQDYVPAEDAGVVAAMKRAGAIVLGKTNTPAFGWTGITTNKVFGSTRNPYDLTRTPGGSSGGAAVAAATAMAALHIGTDGGGSIRVPAAFTGTVGFKPSHGRVPDVPSHTHWLFQHYGPVARSVADIRLVMAAIAGPDPRDPYSLPIGADPSPDLTALKPRLLFTTQLGFVEAVDQEVAAICRSTAFAFRELGWEVEERELAWPNPAPFASVIAGFGLWSRVKGYEHRADEIEDGILAIIDSVRSLPNTAFYDAYFARNVWCAQVSELFESVDLVLTPTTACAPFALGEAAPPEIDGRLATPASWSPYLRAFNITGQPAISVPAGVTQTGLPIGMQIVGPRFCDRLVMDAAAVLERVRPWRVAGAIDALSRQSAIHQSRHAARLP
jgi:aspartyl-tRNA(Asn)/glutamyl-tRNA(Gln) amidotransferase subunit A